jgi:hypothetical protein
LEPPELRPDENVIFELPRVSMLGIPSWQTKNWRAIVSNQRLMLEPKVIRDMPKERHAGVAVHFDLNSILDIQLSRSLRHHFLGVGAGWDILRIEAKDGRVIEVQMFNGPKVRARLLELVERAANPS